MVRIRKPNLATDDKYRPTCDACGKETTAVIMSYGHDYTVWGVALCENCRQEMARTLMENNYSVWPETAER
ncbi:hypothetical protein bpr_II100 (plasmid) [Butyrivibrio proteoclasticus B316]|uniref:Uncharacterized protein n=1 Tax=Butyrivibrio proteoclasticus (strain ATCC 51982 / DSM 14932 / B316) TaxID=515622 RepID=E0S3Q7_BUTPB|nr:hypothetical protein [Butyrivibrio proteoclasticus]ADL36039.1 hypothetical protein bpr_II100 [Butyrivibrio proteoclasticus B316]